MKNLNKSVFVWLLVGISVGAWITFDSIGVAKPTNVAGIFELLSSVVTVDSLLIAFFLKWGWRWSLLHPWLVPYPNLNGVWVGRIVSTYEAGDTSERIAPVAAEVTIRQSFAEVSCVMQTSEMRSTSALAGFDLNVEQQQKQLAYIYCSRPNLTVAQKSPMHDGAVVLEIIGEPPTKLAGRYWTTRGTQGQLELVRSCSTFNARGGNKPKQSRQALQAGGQDSTSSVFRLSTKKNPSMRSDRE